MAGVHGSFGWAVAAAVLLGAATVPAAAQPTGDRDNSRSNESGRQVPTAPVQRVPPPRERPAWMAPLTERDKARIETIVESRSKGRARAEADSGNRAARAAIALMDLDAIPIVEKQLLGTWQCRTYGLGGTLYPQRGADVTANFRCRVDRDKSGLVLKKLTGSVTWLARLTPITSQSMLYSGTYIARGDRQPIYPAGDAYHHQVGILQQLDRDRFRIEMPRPTHTATSDHDVVELFREN